MTTIPVSEAREKLADVTETAQHEPVILERYGRPAAVVISPQRYEQLMAAEDELGDVALFDAAMAEDGDNIPWDEVRADLGW
jgi:antitoxin Phd